MSQEPSTNEQKRILKILSILSILSTLPRTDLKTH